MLNFTSTATATEYTVSIEGHSWVASEKDVQEIINFLNRVGKRTAVSAPERTVSDAPSTSKEVLHVTDEKERKPLQIVGEKVWQEDFLTVVNDGGAFRVYIHCPIGGKKGKAVRYAIKSSASELGAKFSGDYDKGIFHWTFPSKEAADKFVQSRKDWAENKGE